MSVGTPSTVTALLSVLVAVLIGRALRVLATRLKRKEWEDERMTGEPQEIPQVNCPWTDSPFFRRELARREQTLSADMIEKAVQFHDQGYLVLRGAIPAELLDRVRAEVEPFYDDPEIVEVRRVQDAWKRGVASVHELATYAPILSLLNALYEREPVPFQTLNFKWGTEQEGHSDSIHFSCLPARYMCGVWVALEDTTATNGPLFYHPGSHQLPEVTVYDLGETVDDRHYHRYEQFQRELMVETGIEAAELHAKKGDVLVWSSNIVHGGRPVLDKASTRWSQVTHYYFAGCTYYVPFLSDIPMGELFLKDVVNLSTGIAVTHTYNGQSLSIVPWRDGRSRISFDRSESLDEVVRDNEPTAELTETRQALDIARAELTQIRGSESYRLGNLIVRPVHRLFDLVRARSPGR